MKKQMTLLGILAAGLMVLSACADNGYFGRLLARTSVNVPTETTEAPVGAPDGAVNPDLDFFNVVNNWIQPDDQPLAKPEIVFVVDTSGSMRNEVTAVKDSIQGWVDTLESQGILDYCLGVMPAHISSSNAGKLVAASGNDKCICTFGNNAVSAASATQKFRQNLDQVLNVASGGAAVEAPIYSAHVALNDAAVKASNEAAGCFREDTSLVFIPVSDENDLCAVPNDGGIEFENELYVGAGNDFSTTRGDPLYGGRIHGDEAPLRKSTCTNGMADIMTGKYTNIISHETLAADVQLHNGDLPSSGAAIGYDPNNPGNGGDPFWGGLNFAAEYGNSLVDMQDSVDGDAAAFQASMNAMADKLVQDISFYDSFTLSDTICDVNGNRIFPDEEAYVTVKVNGTTIDPANWSINTTGQKIIFEQSFLWASKDAVEVTYLRCE